MEMTQLTKVKQNIHQNKDKSCNLIKHKKTNSRPNLAVWTVFVNCAHWRGSTLAIYKTVLIIFPLNLQTTTITLDVVKWRWGGQQLDDHPKWLANVLADAPLTLILSSLRYLYSFTNFSQLHINTYLMTAPNVNTHSQRNETTESEGVVN